MSHQWGNIDQANNSPIWAPTWINQAPSANNRDALYENANANFGFGNTVTVDTQAANNGWVIVKTGSGGRAGRVQTELLVAMNSLVPNTSNSSN